MALTDVQTKFAEGLVGGRYRVEGFDGEVKSWVDFGGDSILLVCVGSHGPFTARQVVPVEDEEQERRRFAAEAQTEEQIEESRKRQAQFEADARAASTEQFKVELATFANVDPTDEKAMAALQKRLAGL